MNENGERQRDRVDIKKREDQDVRPRLLTVEQAAVYLNIAVRTLYNRTGPNAINPFPVQPKRIGRSLRFDRRELDNFIDGL